MSLFCSILCFTQCSFDLTFRLKTALLKQNMTIPHISVVEIVIESIFGTDYSTDSLALNAHDSTTSRIRDRALITFFFFSFALH